MSQPGKRELEQDIERMFGKGNKFYLSSAGGTKLGVSYIVVYDEYDYEMSLYDVCHGQMFSLAENSREVYTSLYIRDAKYLDVAKRWFNWILSDKGPWRDAAKGHTVHYDDKGVPLYVHLINCDNEEVDGRLFFSLLHMTRVAFEHPGSLVLWAYLMDKMGYDEVKAYACCHRMDYENDDTVSQSDRSHIFLDSYGSKVDLAAMRSGRPHVSFVRSFSRGGFNAISAIWSERKDRKLDYLFIDCRVENLRKKKSTRKSMFPGLDYFFSKPAAPPQFSLPALIKVWDKQYV